MGSMGILIAITCIANYISGMILAREKYDTLKMIVYIVVQVLLSYLLIDKVPRIIVYTGIIGTVYLLYDKSKSFDYSLVIALFVQIIIMIADVIESNLAILITKKDINTLLYRNDYNMIIYAFIAILILSLLSAFVSWVVNKKMKMKMLDFKEINSKLLIVILLINFIIIFSSGNIFGNENIVSEYKEILFDDYYNIDNERYFKKEYKYFIEGKFDKAKEIYLKNKNNLANYEMKVLEHIENTEKMELPVKNIESVSKYVFYKKKIFDIVNLLKIFCGIFGVGLSSCLCFAIYTVIYYFLMLVIKGQCTNVNRYVIAVLSIIPGIMMTFKLRKEWYDMFAIPNDLESNEKISKLEKKLILVYIILSFIIMIVNIKLI